MVSEGRGFPPASRGKKSKKKTYPSLTIRTAAGRGADRPPKNNRLFSQRRPVVRVKGGKASARERSHAESSKLERWH